MAQLMLELEGVHNYAGPWQITTRHDQTVRKLADRHYSRKTIGHKFFTRPGFNIVMRTADGKAAMIVRRGIRDDKYRDMNTCEISLFRNEGKYRSSDLIKHGMYLALTEWDKQGFPAPNSILTFINANKVKSEIKGKCFLHAGFQYIGQTQKGLLIMEMDAKELPYLLVKEIAAFQYFRFVQREIRAAMRGNEYGEDMFTNCRVCS